MLARSAAQEWLDRDPRVKLTLRLAEDELSLSASHPDWPSLSLRRDQAAFLVATEYSVNWHERRLALFDDEERLVMEFIGAMAETSWEPSSSSVKPEGSKPDLPVRIPAAVLLGAWWPHPERRLTQGRYLGRAARWRDPWIEDFPRRERRERALLAVLLGLFAALSWLGALSPTSPPIGRLAFGLLALALTVAIVKILAWRPRYLD
jgi:hypothetical protein